jgi:hypothetical protein
VRVQTLRAAPMRRGIRKRGSFDYIRAAAVTTIRTLAKREARFIEDSSMGGYGAARLGLKYPEIFGTSLILTDLSQANGLDWRDCDNCVIAGCTVRRFAAEGIGIRGGRDCGIYGCDLYSLGRNATTVTGGDRKTLTPARHYVENCRMYEFGRLDHTYVPGVQLEGVGNRVAHNRFYECPASVVRIEGNDHVLEYNRVHRAEPKTALKSVAPRS